jgi:hypothetical protein
VCCKGEIHLGAMTPYPVRYLPQQTCLFTIWPFPDGGEKRMTLIRLVSGVIIIIIIIIGIIIIVTTIASTCVTM